MTATKQMNKHLNAIEEPAISFKNKATFLKTSPTQHHYDTKPCGKGSFSRRGHTKYKTDCYGLDIARLKILENQVFPVAYIICHKTFPQIRPQKEYSLLA